MTPVRQQLPRFRRSTDRLPAAGLGVVLLFLLFLPARDPVTHSLTVEWRPSAELAFLLFLAAIIGVARPQIVEARPAARLLAILVGLAALLNLVHAATPTLLGRDLNLYWDLQHLPSLFGLARESAGSWSVASAAALVFGAVSLVVASAYWIWRNVLIALTDRRVAIGLVIFLGVTLDVT